MEIPVMIWDGNCGFCRYWITRWQKITKHTIEFASYQEAAERFPDVDVVHFKQASRFIDIDGKIYSGPQSAYKSLAYSKRWQWMDRWYQKGGAFSKLSDHFYQLIANNRNFFFKLTKALFGSNPEEPRPFWMVYVGVILYFIYMF